MLESLGGFIPVNPHEYTEWEQPSDGKEADMRKNGMQLTSILKNMIEAR